jgi:hypothetical protein
MHTRKLKMVGVPHDAFFGNVEGV